MMLRQVCDEVQYCPSHFYHHLWLNLSSVSGLESDDSCEVSFKDACVYESKQTVNGKVPSENGVWERR